MFLTVCILGGTITSASVSVKVTTRCWFAYSLCFSYPASPVSCCKVSVSIFGYFLFYFGSSLAFLWLYCVLCLVFLLLPPYSHLVLGTFSFPGVFHSTLARSVSACI